MAISFIDLNGQSSRRVFGLIAGKPGIGKTSQMLTFPKDEVLAISLENGFLSVAGSGIKALKAESYEDMMAVLKDAKYIPKGTKTIFIDSLSELYDLIRIEAKELFEPKQNFAKHEEVKMKLSTIIRMARNLDSYDVFFICHTKEEKNGIALEQELAFDGKLPEEVKRQFDVIVHMEPSSNPELGDRCLITDAAVSKVAKARVSPYFKADVKPVEKANLYQLTKKLKGE